MKPLLFVRLLLFFVVLGVGTVAIRAEDLAVVRARIEKRVESVVRFKARHAAGENNRGFLEMREALSGEEQRILSDENTDRRLVYAAIAAQNKISVDEVGRTRAAKLAAEAKRGEWIQEPGGMWKQKG